MTDRSDLTGLGRLPSKNGPNKAFRLMAPEPKRGVRRKTHYVRGVLDQGSTSQCVAYSGAKYLETHPVKNRLHMPIPELYRECQRNDEWAGEEPDYEGTSVHALFRILKREGYIAEYRWAFDVDTMVNHILSTGPIVVGTSWFQNMFSSDRWDFLSPTGFNAGGHAYLLVGADIDKRCPDGSKGAFTMLNSWGASWSSNGRARISLKDMQTLLDDQGEACVASEIVRAA